MAYEISHHSRHLNAITGHFRRLAGLKGSPKTSSKVNRRPFSSWRSPCLISFIREGLRRMALVSRHPSYSSALRRTAAGRPFRVMTSSSSSFSQSATNWLRRALASDKLSTRAITVSLHRLEFRLVPVVNVVKPDNGSSKHLFVSPNYSIRSRQHVRRN